MIRVFEDYSVAFMKAARRVQDLEVKEPGTFDEQTCILTFTVHFPPDASNPHGKATWHLHESGHVDVNFDIEVPKFGKSMPQFQMQFEPVLNLGAL